MKILPFMAVSAVLFCGTAFSIEAKLDSQQEMNASIELVKMKLKVDRDHPNYHTIWDNDENKFNEYLKGFSDGEKLANSLIKDPSQGESKKEPNRNQSATNPYKCGKADGFWYVYDQKNSNINNSNKLKKHHKK